MSSKTEKKQNFLRSEIIEKGYNPAEFAGFLAENRTDGKAKRLKE
jgi:hypothetical protein